MSIQDVRDMPVAGLNGHAKTPLQDQIKKYSDDMPVNDKQCSKFGSRLNHKTGEVAAHSSKSVSAVSLQCGTPSPEYLNGYDAIVWNSDKGI